MKLSVRLWKPRSRGDEVLFHTFKSQEERRKYGGSAFIEIQFCNMPFQATTKELVAVESIQNWKNDSLYVYIDDDSAFFQEYSRIFDCGTYCNLQTGVVDLYGINYYASLREAALNLGLYIIFVLVRPGKMIFSGSEV